MGTSAEGTEASCSTGGGTSGLRAGAGDVADLSAPVALSAGSSTSSETTGVAASSRRLGAVAGLHGKSDQHSIIHDVLATYDMSFLSALVARLGLGVGGAVTGDVSLQSAWM